MTREKSLVEAELADTLETLAEGSEELATFWLNHSYMINAVKLQLVKGRVDTETYAKIATHGKDYDVLCMKQQEAAVRALRLFTELHL